MFLYAESINLPYTDETLQYRGYGLIVDNDKGYPLSVGEDCDPNPRRECESDHLLSRKITHLERNNSPALRVRIQSHFEPKTELFMRQGGFQPLHQKRLPSDYSIGRVYVMSPDLKETHLAKTRSGLCHRVKQFVFKGSRTQSNIQFQISTNHRNRY